MCVASGVSITRRTSSSTRRQHLEQLAATAEQHRDLATPREDRTAATITAQLSTAPISTSNALLDPTAGDRFGEVFAMWD